MANGRYKWHCMHSHHPSRDSLLRAAYKGEIKSVPISCMLIREYTAG